MQADTLQVSHGRCLSTFSCGLTFSSSEKNCRGHDGRPQAVFVTDGGLRDLFGLVEDVRDLPDLALSSQELSGLNSTPRTVASISAARSSA